MDHSGCVNSVSMSCGLSTVEVPLVTYGLTVEETVLISGWPCLLVAV